MRRIGVNGDVDSALARIRDGELYFIRRNNAWFRPGAKGYTADLARAGIYSAKDARAWLNHGGVTVVAVASMRRELSERVQELLQAAADLNELVMALR